MDNFKVNYLKSIIKVLEEYEGISEVDKSNLNQCIGTLFQEIRIDGDITEELAKELGLQFLLPREKQC